MRSLLICHEEETLNHFALPRWLASFSTLAGIMVLRESLTQRRQRIKRELNRAGILRFADVLAFRLYYKLCIAGMDRRWEARRLKQMEQRYPAVPVSTPTLLCSSPNSLQAGEFVAQCAPDLMIPRCKVILKEEVFTIPSHGTFVMHPGICPEYRNAHGCFWALVNRDLERVGMTLLRIDRGIDTGPIFGYFNCAIDERNESHIVIQHRTVLDNLDSIQECL